MDKYKKHNLRDHIYEIPGMYVGSVDVSPLQAHIYNDTTSQMELKELHVVPALFKIVDEVVVNATDQWVRMKLDPKPDSKPVKNIKIKVDQSTGVIEVYNDGDSIDVERLPLYDNVYVPEMIFGQLLTSTNYDNGKNGKESVVSGVHGLGVKLCNVFSKEFSIDLVDHRKKKHYTQTWKNNMLEKEEPEIKYSAKSPYTLVKFLPDYKRFGLDGLTDDMYAIIRKRAFDACACTDNTVNIYFNDQKIEIKDFEKYADLFLGNVKDGGRPRAYEKVGERWEVIATYAINGYEHVSFVNGINTFLGGKHVDYITNQITKKLSELISTKKKKEVKALHIKENLMVFVKCSIVNPAFNSQTKETLTTPISKFGSKAELSDKFFTNLFKTGIVEKVINLSDFHEEKKMTKTDGKKRSTILGIENLDDANWAGTNKSAECTLILTEGLSAKTMAIAGLSEVGRDRWGVFPLRGKLMNVKDAAAKKIYENEEITNIKKIIGLESGKVYSDVSELRYGRVMLMTDQDSVTGDTPILVRKDGQIDIITIETIAEYDWFENINGKEYNGTSYEVWTEKGWTSITHVIRHKVNKQLYRVSTPSGIVDVTEDHSLLDSYGNKVSPLECIPHQELLHNFPYLGIDHGDDSSLSMSEAWVIGLFFACGAVDEYGWHMDTNDILILEKAKHTLKLTYGYDFQIINTSFNRWRMIVNGVSDIGKIYKKMCYQQGTNYKKIPRKLMNAPISVRKAFIHGYECQTFWPITLDNKITAQSLYFMLMSTQHQVYIRHANSKYHLYVSPLEEKITQNMNIIKQIVKLGTTNDFVYDLETSNHHFQAGIGSMIVHNTDGQHIKGLVMNMFHSLWPSLVQAKGFQFLHSMLTPIVKVFKGKEKKSFYSLTDFEQWKVQNEDGKGWSIKYYKGLGTSNDDEAKEYFKAMRDVTYTWTASGEKSQPSQSEEALDLAFNKSRADDRKDWLSQYNRKVILDYNDSQVSYEDFVHKELIHFSNYDLERSIPNMVDGLKTSQRKILYCCFKKPLWEKEIRVAQLASYVSENSAYHHGEVSLQGAIVAMAQNFPGSNNINLLAPNGQFGSKSHMGKDASQPRYIHTQLREITGKLFIKEDNELLKYLDDDGYLVEPEYYVPIIPMILVNGAIGIGTGFSTNIPCYNPKDIIRVLKGLMNGEDFDDDAEDLKPWYRGFKGIIEKVNGKWTSFGLYQKLTATKLQITELPVGIATNDFKEMIEKMICNKDIQSPIKSYESHYTPNDVNFILHFTSASALDEFDVEKELKLSSTKNLGVTNMYAFNDKCQITKYKSAIHIIKEFFTIRLEFYERRRAHLLDKLENDMKRLNNKIRFVMDVINGVIIVHKMRKAELEDKLEEMEYAKCDDSYDYLTRIPIYNFTLDQVEKLKDDIKNKEIQIKLVEDTTANDMWKQELDVLNTFVDNECKEITAPKKTVPKKLSLKVKNT